jgi:hypothetical protein
VKLLEFPCAFLNTWLQAAETLVRTRRHSLAGTKASKENSNDHMVSRVVLNSKVSSFLTARVGICKLEKVYDVISAKFHHEDWIPTKIGFR